MRVPVERIQVMLSHFSESWLGLSRPSTSSLLSGRKKTWMPATSAGMTLER
jgi:hypothetical protein